MKKIYKTAIIGGGASGLAAAAMLGRSDTVVLERMARVGKKIAATGNGRGNVSNARISPDNYHSMAGNAPAFVSPALSAFGTQDTVKFLESLGAMAVEENGKIYPASLQAASIVDLLRQKLGELEADIVTEFFVKKIEAVNGGFSIFSDEGMVRAENVILAAGGKCHRELGSDGSGYDLAKQLGHTVTKLLPSLVQLKTETEKIRGLRGIKQEVRLTLLDKNVPIISEKGDLLFTDYGVSGDAVFRISGFAASARQPVLQIEFMPGVGRDKLEEFLMRKAKNCPSVSACDLLTGCMNKLTGRAVAACAGISLGNGSENAIKALVGAVKDFRLPVTGSLGFDSAQVTRGGVMLSEVDPNSMRSLKHGGCYIVGELLDIDGDCGGYNLQWAFASANAAAADILKKCE